MSQQLGSAYVLDEPIGRGAMGEVWRGRVSATGEAIAAKLLLVEHTQDQELISRFVQERSILVSLDHPHLVKVRDLVAEGSSLAIVMDLVEGSDLRAHLRAHERLAPSEAVRLTLQVLEALQAAHPRVLHRDVKPENVLLDISSGTPEVRLSDFGIARLTEGTAVKMSQLIGTAEYLAPEVIAAEMVSPAADVYAVGIMLYEMLAGRTPFVGKGQSYSIVRRQVDASPPPLDGLPPALWAVIEQLLVKDPSARPGATGAMALLREVEASLIGVPPIPAPPLIEEWDKAEEVRYTSSSTELKGMERPDDLELASPPVALDAGMSPGDEAGTVVVDRPVVRLPMPPPDVDLDEPARGINRAALLAGVGVVVLGVIAAIVLQRGESTEAGSSSGSTTVPSGSLEKSAGQDFDNDLLSLNRTFELVPDDEGGYTLKATITYTALDSLQGPVVEILPRSLVSLTLAEPTWTTSSAEPEPEPALVDAEDGRAVAYSFEVDDDTEIAYELRGIDVADGKPEELLSGALTEVEAELDSVLAGASASTESRPLWLMAIEKSLDVEAPVDAVAGETSPFTVSAVLRNEEDEERVALLGSDGRPSDLLQWIGVDGVILSTSGGGSICTIADGVNRVKGWSEGPCEVTVTVGPLSGTTIPFQVINERPG